MQKRLNFYCSVSLFVAIFALPVFAGNINIGGKWMFLLDPESTGIEGDFYKKNLTEEFRLPGSNVENMKGFDVTVDTKFTGSIYDSSWYFNPHMERYRQPGNIKMPFWLTQNKYYTGLAWYQREIEIPQHWQGKLIRLYLERPHYITKVWVDDNLAGSHNSLNTPHIFDLSPFVQAGKKYKLTICIDNKLKSLDVGANSHSVTDHTQGNWNGIVGRLELQAKNQIFVDDVKVFPDLKQKKAVVKILLKNMTLAKSGVNLWVKAKSFNSAVSHSFEINKKTVLNKAVAEQWVEMELQLGDKMQTWDEFDPTLYQLEVIAGTKTGRDTLQTQFGMREITIDGKWIFVNGRKTMLRGTVENALFPLTGYPPMDVDSWLKVFRVCKKYGLNHMRFHSYGPPEAAFKAADLVGIYLQPEGPSWPNHSTQLGRGFPIDTFLLEETKRMTRFYGNYASFTMLAAGNEPRGNWVQWVGKFVDYWKATDPRRIYTGASVGGSWSWQPKNQFHVKAGARGLEWHRMRPESMSDFSDKIDTVKQPFVSHETGQWCVFPNFDEIKKYKGVTRAKNFELFQEEFERNDLGGLSREFLHASGKLQLLCYKHEIERTMRTPGYAGFQLLSLNDFSGQGTALVGVLDAFWDEKGYADASDFSKFCNATVPLIRTNSFVYTNDQMLQASVEIAHFGAKELTDRDIIMRIRNKAGKIIEEKRIAKLTIPIGNNIPAGEISLELKHFTEATAINLEIAIDGTTYHNDWNFWIYPANPVKMPENDIYIAKTLDVKAIKMLESGGKVLLLAAGKIEYGKDVVQHYSPAFWNTSWFKMRPPHTTGVYVRNYHPVFKNFITDSWADMQWWELVNRTQTMLLTDFPRGFQPIVQPIDTWFINRKLGMLIEAKVGKGRLMMTTMDLESSLDNRPVASAMYQAIIRYMNSDEFKPAIDVPVQNINDLFTKKAEPYNFFSRTSPDELKQGKI